VAPLEDVRIENVMSLIPSKLRVNFPQSIADLSDEVRDDYLLSVKKAIVDFVLRDSSEVEGKDAEAKLKSQLKTPEHRLEMTVVPKPWHSSFEKARRDINKNLHSINPCMSQVLKLWYTTFKYVVSLKPFFTVVAIFFIILLYNCLNSKLRMIDIEEFKSLQSSIELPIFLSSCKKSVEYAKEQLNKK
jgi:dynein heavy chain, axonemal